MKTLLANLLVLAAVTTGSNSLSSASNLKVTRNVLNLKRSTKSLNHLQKRDGAAVTPLKYVEGFVFLTDITVNGDSYPVQVNTGSSETWLAAKGISCIGYYDNSPVCKFGPLYDPSASKTFQEVQGRIFNITYGDGESLTGKVGLETITVAGISVPNQAFGIADHAHYSMDGESSGSLGLLYGPWSDNDDKSVKKKYYSSIFPNMVEEFGVPPIFSVVLQKGSGGILAIGGIPDVAHESKFYDAPLIGGSVDSTGKKVYPSYKIKIDGYVVSKASEDSDTPQLLEKGASTTVAMATALVYAPFKVGVLVAASFDPPGQWDDGVKSWVVDCKAEPPKFGVSIQENIFYVKPENMLVPLDNGVCMSGVRPGTGKNVLGASWLMGVVSVFDVGAEKMSFSALT